jgi:hypothetical protein
LQRGEAKTLAIKNHNEGQHMKYPRDSIVGEAMSDIQAESLARRERLAQMIEGRAVGAASFDPLEGHIVSRRIARKDARVSEATLSAQMPENQVALSPQGTDLAEPEGGMTEKVGRKPRPIRDKDTTRPCISRGGRG